jgi:hypothetical protein
MQNLVLLFGRGGGKFLDTRKHLAHSRLQFGQALLICLLVVDREGGQAAIHEIDHTSFARTRSIVCWDDTSGNGIDLGSLLGGKEFEFRAWGRLRRAVGVLCCRKKGRPMRGDPGGAQAGASA